MAKKDDELTAVITDPKAHAERWWIAVTFIAVSVIVAIIAMWFWEVVAEGLRGNSFIPLAATIGMYVAGAGGVLAALLVVARKQVANKVLTVAAQIGWVCGIAMIINTVVYLFQQERSFTSSFGNIFESFVDFNRVEIGSFGISITGTLTIILIIASITAVQKRKK
jgi:hypothetical protein